MATQLSSQLQSKIDGYLSSFEREMQWAVDLACNWDEAEEIERVDLAAEWGLIMDFYVRLLTFEREHQFAPDQQRRFDAARDLFRAHESRLAIRLGPHWVTSDPPESWFTADHSIT